MSLTDKIRKFANSPKGQQLIDRGRRELSKPQNQQKVRSLLSKLQGRKP